MKHPAFAALGLRDDADEKAIKQAYARLLKDNRPDENPAGFQKLNETYQAALAALKWRLTHDQQYDFEIEDVPRQSEPLVPKISTDDSLPPGVTPPGTVSDVGPTDDLAFDDDANAGVDVVAFNERLIAEAQISEDAPFKHWFERETRDWPLDVAPMVGHALVHMWTETHPPISVGQFEIIAAKCGFDDVLRHYNPMLIGGLRHNIAAHQDFDERSRRHAVMFGQPGRKELCQYMAWTGRGEYAAWQTRLYAGLLTSPYAYNYLQATRYVPGAHKALMGFVRNIDEGRLNALSPAINGTTMAFLEWSEAPRARSWFGYVSAAIVILLVLADLRKLYAPPPPRPSIESTAPIKQDANSRALLTLVQRGASMHRQADKLIAAGKQLEAVQACDAIITMFRDDKRGDLEEVLALAYYNKGWLLSGLGRDLEARDVYEFIWETFWKSQHKDVKPLVAMSQVNLGHVYRRTGRHPDSVAAYVRVYSMYGDETDVRLRAQGAKSRFALAEYYSMTGKRDDARRLATSVSDRYKNETDPRIMHYVTASQALLVGLDAPR